jgi:pSer/pThr/pTyr-binding forkhead associated (FHA) protein
MRLVFCSKRASERIHELVEGRTSVGRSGANMLAIRDDSVSRRHGGILTWGSEVIVRDFGSRNGTWVGDKLLNGAQFSVAPGEGIRFGSSECHSIE